MTYIKKGEFLFTPQQSWRVSWQPFRVTTFCYHPNTISVREFEKMRRALPQYRANFIRFEKELLNERKLDFIDQGMRGLCFLRDKMISSVMNIWGIGSKQ